jgi:hypothetical protein
MNDLQADHEYHFYVDAKQYDWKQRAISGLDIKVVASIPATYQLYLEESGHTPDRPISDGDSVVLEGDEKHFFAVPPATFGHK